MMRPYGEELKVYLYREPVDMRKWLERKNLPFAGFAYGTARECLEALRRALIFSSSPVSGVGGRRR